jgi:SH3-like domain-containing protein
MVTIEHRTGDWYRIIMTDGTRGWINGNALIFDAGVRAGSTVRVGAFETRLETMGLDY